MHMVNLLSITLRLPPASRAGFWYLETGVRAQAHLFSASTAFCEFRHDVGVFGRSGVLVTLG